MKKYLMTGVAAIAFAATFTSCSKTDLYDESKVEEQKVQSTRDKYETNFVKRFGNIGKGQKWGFDNTPIPQSASTRSHFKNKNQYRDFLNVPNAPTENEINVVTQWFSTHESPATVNVNWSDFFVWQISSTANGKSHMDQLWCGASKESMEHVNDFNAGNNTNMEHVGPATYMWNSGTAEFAYQESLTNGTHTVYDHFVCIPGSVIAPNDPDVKDYYYVGFDYEATGTDPNQQVARDNLFNDWIVRITPGEYKNAVRIVCEDLGTTDDFDFNDVVFDAVFNPNELGGGNTVIITVRAAGGRLPLYVGGTEVHGALGVPVSQEGIVNTGRKTVPIAIYRIPFTGSRSWTYLDYNSIEVKVESEDAIYVLQSPEEKAPEKILVGTDFTWPGERISIESVYTNFSDYVQNPSKYSYNTWYK